MRVHTHASRRQRIRDLLLLTVLLLTPLARASSGSLGGVGIWDEREQRQPELSQALNAAMQIHQGAGARDLTGGSRKLACIQYDCLRALAKKEGLAWIAGGQLRAQQPPEKDSRHDTQRASWKLHLFLFDARRSGPISVDLSGSIEDLATALPQALDRLLLRRNDALTESLPPPSLVGNPPGPHHRAESAARPLRIVLASSLGVVAILGLTGGIVAHALHGQPATAAVCDEAPTLVRPHDTSCLYQTTPLFVSGYSLAAASLLGLGLTLGLP